MTTYLKFQPSDRITLNLASNEAARTVVVVQNTSKCVRAWSEGRALRSALRPFFGCVWMCCRLVVGCGSLVSLCVPCVREHET